jgi:hypothetical protein
VGNVGAGFKPAPTTHPPFVPPIKGGISLIHVVAAGLIFSLCPLPDCAGTADRRLCGELLVKLFWFEEREEDDFSDGYIVCQNHNKSIDTYTKPAGRRHTVF